MKIGITSAVVAAIFVLAGPVWGQECMDCGLVEYPDGFYSSCSFAYNGSAGCSQDELDDVSACNESGGDCSSSAYLLEVETIILAVAGNPQLDDTVMNSLGKLINVSRLLSRPCESAQIRIAAEADDEQRQLTARPQLTL